MTQLTRRRGEAHSTAFGVAGVTGRFRIGLRRTIPVATSTCTGSGSMSDDAGIRPYSEGSFGPASANRGFLVWELRTTV